MDPLSSPANTAAIIAGEASGQLARFCPGQLERETFDNDNAAEGGRERHMEETFLAPYTLQEPNLRRASRLDFTRLLAFRKHRFDL